MFTFNMDLFAIVRIHTTVSLNYAMKYPKSGVLGARSH